MADKREKWTPLLCNYPNSEKVNSVSFEAEVLYTRLLAACDDNANYDGTPTLIMCGLFAKRFEQGQIDVTKAGRIRDELVTAGLIMLYREGKKDYLHVLNCKKSIRGDIKPDVRFPEFTQPLNKKRLAVPVTNPGRVRNEIVSPTTTTTTTTTIDNQDIDKGGIDKNSFVAFELPLQKLCLRTIGEIEKILPVRTQREATTFANILRHVKAYCLDGRTDRAESIFQDVASLAKEAAKSNCTNKKGFFVSLVKKRYGFNNHGSGK